MWSTKPLFFACLACMAFVPCARGQLRWREAVPVNVGSYSYEFTALDCWHNVCTVAAVRHDDAARFTDNYWAVVFFRSNDGGETWAEEDPGLPHSKVDNNNYIRYLQQIDSLHAVAMSDSGTVILTSDGGSTWLRRDLPVRYDQRDFHFSDSNTGIVTLWSNIPNNIYTTRDGGISWNRSPWDPWLTATMCHSDGGERFRAITGANGPTYYTSDSWRTVDSTSLIVPHGGPGDTDLIVGCNFRGDTLVIFGEHRDSQGVGPIFLISTDNGANWSPLAYPPAFGSSTESMSSLDAVIAFAGVGFGNRHLFKSTDHGLSWSADTLIYSSDTTETDINAIGVLSGGEAIAILGNSPTILATELMVGEPSNAIVRNPNHSAVASVVYPNPADQILKIEPSQAGRHFAVIDMLGQDVLNGTVPDSSLPALDVASLPAGQYFLICGSAISGFVKQ